jgi:uncharacterized metal-binding protein
MSAAQQYDQEIYKRWKLVLFDEHSEIESPYYDREITVDIAVEKARERGYHSFEIVHCVETVKRYTVNPTPDK